MNNRFQSALLLTLLLLTPLVGIVGADEVEPAPTCEILVDWEYDWALDDNGTWQEIVIHRYRTTFDPIFENGTSPSGVTVFVQHIRDGQIIANEADSSYVVAGGEIDIVLPDEPEFLDEVFVEVSSAEASCSRSIDMTIWNQPISDHEITRETTWELDNQADGGSSLYFEGRGWQKRTGESLSSSELGNGSLILDLDTGTDQIYLTLDLHNVWMNETYEGTEISRQIFEMRGTGALEFQSDSQDSLIDIEANVYQAYILRDWENGILSERLTLEASGSISYNGGSNNSTEGGYGELSVFYLETWDEDGVRRLSDTQIDANLSLRLQTQEEAFSIELDEFRSREKWLDGVREEQSLKIKGSGEFGFPIEDSSFEVQVNGTVPDIHYEVIGGEVVEDSIIVDGQYTGDASGSFGYVRQIDNSLIEENSTGERFEVDVIQNEVWFNISGTPIGPLGQEIEAEHNLTYEYTVPQTDWANRTIRYMYVEDNGTVTNEYPDRSPIIMEPERPQYEGDMNITAFRESGVVPDEYLIGDIFPTSSDGGDQRIEITGFSIGIADGHEVELAEWRDTESEDGFTAYGTVINEGLLAGLLHEVNRIIEIDLPINNDNENQTQLVRVVEHQTLERVLYPSVITEAENTPPTLLSLSFREGILFTEGGIAHLEAVIEDVDTDVIGVVVDLSDFGLGIITLSDSGLNGDEVIQDSVWTAKINHEGLEFGNLSVSVKIDDIWTEVQTTTYLEITNSAPRVISRQFTPEFAYRGEEITASLDVQDGHGVSSVQIDLLSAGGELIPLVYDSEIGRWTGQFILPDSLAPGLRTIPLQVEDNQGASALIDGGSVIQVLNEAPIITNVSFYENGEWVSVIEIPKSGPKTYTIEVSITDPDGVSSAQAKIGRLAPIGKSETWLLLKDDGEDGDILAGDGIFSMEFEVRSTLTEGEIEFFVRSSDIFQSLTPIDEQTYSVTLVEEKSSGLGGTNWIAENSTTLVIIVLLLLLALAATAIVLTMRNADFD